MHAELHPLSSGTFAEQVHQTVLVYLLVHNLLGSRMPLDRPYMTQLETSFSPVDPSLIPA